MVVVDEFGGNVGIVTLQRVIAEVIGQLSDELGLGRWEFGRLAADEFLVDSAWPFTRCTTWRSSPPRWRAGAHRRLHRLRSSKLTIAPASELRFPRVAKTNACER